MSIDPRAVLLVAAESGSDPRTVRKRLRGEQVRPLAAARIDEALAKVGVAAAPEQTKSTA